MKRTQWHQLFGLLLADFFTGSPFSVEVDKDLSIKKQLLDIVIIRRRRGRYAGQLPDGFEGLVDHNLITFKSLWDVLDDWTLKELTGHYVNYRKQVSPSLDKLLPEGDYHLYAVCSRFPRDLAGTVDLKRVQDGVYDCHRGTDVIRLIVVSELPLTENNALLHLLSASPELVRYGVDHYEQHSADTSTLLNKLFEGYEREGIAVPYTMEDFRRDYTKEHLTDLTPEERLEGLSPDEVLSRFSLEERLAGFSPREIENILKRRKDETVRRRKKRK